MCSKYPVAFIKQVHMKTSVIRYTGLCSIYSPSNKYDVSFNGLLCTSYLSVTTYIIDHNKYPNILSPVDHLLMHIICTSCNKVTNGAF